MSSQPIFHSNVSIHGYILSDSNRQIRGQSGSRRFILTSDMQHHMKLVQGVTGNCVNMTAHWGGKDLTHSVSLVRTHIEVESPLNVRLGWVSNTLGQVRKL